MLRPTVLRLLAGSGVALAGCAAVEVAPPPPEECAIIAAAAHRLDAEGYFAREKRHGAETKLSDLSFPERPPSAAGKAPVALDLAQCPGLLDFSRSRGWDVVRPIRYLGQYATGGGVQWFTRPQKTQGGAVEVRLGTGRPSGWVVTLRTVEGAWVVEEVGLSVSGA